MTQAWPADSWNGPVLVVRLSSLGDVILTTGVLRALKERRPDLVIHFLTRRAYAAPLTASPAIDRLLLEDADPPNPPDERYALVLDWQGGWKGRRAAARYAPNARVIAAPRAALHRRLLVLLGRRIPPPAPFVARLARTVCGSALPSCDWTPQVIPERDRVERLRATLSMRARPSAGWLVFASGAAYPGKAVPARLSEALMSAFQEEGWGVVELLAPGLAGETNGRDDPRWQEAGEAGSRLRFSGSLSDVAALLANADLFVGSDSGILHLATAVGAPALGLFGPTAPCLGFSPLGRAAAFGVDLPCRPCHIHGVSRCWLGHARCWEDMQPSSVVVAAKALLRQEPDGKEHANKRTSE